MTRRRRRPALELPRPIGENRVLMLVDGDNIRGTFREYGLKDLTLDRLLDWVIEPDNIGTTELSQAYFFASVRDVSSLTRKEVPIDDPSRWRLKLYPYSPSGKGYPDSWIYDHATSLIWGYDTLVLVSSDGGSRDGDGGFFKFARHLRNHPDPRKRREVVVIASHLNALRGWTMRASNYEPLERIYPELETVLPWVKYGPPGPVQQPA